MAMTLKETVIKMAARLDELGDYHDCTVLGTLAADLRFSASAETIMTYEIPACAAIRGAHGITFAGKRHHDCLAQVKSAGFGGLWRVSATQGFMTTRGRFVDRKEAMQLMLDAGIPSANKGGEDQATSPAGFRGDELYSEDLY